LTNLAAADVARIEDIKLSANWMAACGAPGQDAALFDTVSAVSTLCQSVGLSIPVGKDSLSMQTSWTHEDEKRQVISPVSLIVTAFAPVQDVRQTLTPQLRTNVGPTSLILIDLGNGKKRMGGSILTQVCNQVGEQTPDADDAETLRTFFVTIRALAESGVLLAYHDRSDGGLMATVCEMAFAGHTGVSLNLVVMDNIWDNGFRQITSSTKPIQTANDLKGFKIRVPVSPLWTSMFKAFDSAPASINFNEVYSALQTKIVDGQENPLALIDTAKLNEVQKFCSLTNHMWDGFWFLANRRAWERLPENLRTIVAKNINAAALKERADIAAMNVTLQKGLTDKGMIFNQTTPESFRERLRAGGFYSEWKGKLGGEAWSVLERYTGKIA